MTRGSPAEAHDGPNQKEEGFQQDMDFARIREKTVDDKRLDRRRYGFERGQQEIAWCGAWVHIRKQCLTYVGRYNRPVNPILGGVLRCMIAMRFMLLYRTSATTECPPKLVNAYASCGDFWPRLIYGIHVAWGHPLMPRGTPLCLQAPTI